MAEVEERIGRIMTRPGVKGLLIVEENGKFLRSTISSSNDTAPKLYAQKISDLAKKTRSVVGDIQTFKEKPISERNVYKELILFVTSLANTSPQLRL